MSKSTVLVPPSKTPASSGSDKKDVVLIHLSASEVVVAIKQHFDHDAGIMIVSHPMILTRDADNEETGAPRLQFYQWGITSMFDSVPINTDSLQVLPIAIGGLLRDSYLRCIAQLKAKWNRRNIEEIKPIDKSRNKVVSDRFTIEFDPSDN